MNQDEGQYNLTQVFDELLEKKSQRVNNKLATPPSQAENQPRLGIHQSPLSVDKRNSDSQKCSQVSDISEGTLYFNDPDESLQ